MRPWARFDDLRAGESRLLRATCGVLRADRLEDVVPVLRAVERAADEGRWAFGFVAYEAAPAFDEALAVHPGVDGLPLAWFGVADEAVAVPPITPAGGSGYEAGPWACEWTREEHGNAVEAVRAHIAEGDTYQVNLTTRLTGTVAGDPAWLYTDLAAAQGGTHNAYLDTGRFAVVSASPELFFAFRDGEDGVVTMRPMKGTAPRGATPDEDRRLADELRTSPKERAENVMIVDLVRNDLARIAAQPPTVTILCAVETYPTVHQLVSEVVVPTRPGTGLVDVFRAVFPSGSVTGAPKNSTMRIIRELEARPRGVYCGAVGLVGPPGDATRFNVPIRTLLVDRERGTGVYGAGGGITWGSRPDAEYDELLVKARILPRSTS